MKINYEIKKRRYLNVAGISFNDKDILYNFFRSLAQQKELNLQGYPVRKLLSRLFNLTEDITFRQNATQTFRDVLEGIVSHNNKQVNYCDNKLLVSDIDHPVMNQMASVILPSKFVYRAKFIEKVILNKVGSTEEITEIYLKNIFRYNIKIVLIPHVNWINGGKFNVKSICRDIKKFDKSIVTIIDGVQALANTETIIDTDGTCNKDIDFYIGNGQKWIGSPMPIGFVRVANKYLKINSFRDYLFISDCFSGFAGGLKYLEKLSEDTYNIPLAMLFNSVINRLCDKNSEIHPRYFLTVIENLEPIRELLVINGLQILDSSYEMRTGIVAISGEESLMCKIHEALNKNSFCNTKAKIDYKGKSLSFIRISSPLKPLQQIDLEIFNKCLK